MKTLFLLSILSLVLSCSENSDFPTEFAGTWEYDINSVHAEIDQMKISSEKNKALKNSFVDLEKGQKYKVTNNGKFTYPQLPEGVYIQLELVSKVDNGYIFSQKNSMNRSVIEYSMNTIENGVWKSILLDNKFKPLFPEYPNTYLKRND